jgi:pyruvate/2-oxoglutarate/acetoin dehydrogenase E1 component
MPDEVRYMDAIREGMAIAMRKDPHVIVMGVDVGASGGAFAVTKGLVDEFGPERVRDTPISEAAVVGAAVGAAMTGLCPIVELMFIDFLGVCLDALMNQAAKLHYMSGGSVSVPMVLRTQNGGGRSAGAQHSQSLEGLLAQIPGLKVYCPADVQDARDLMLAAISDPGPVIYLENRRLYGLRGQLDDGAEPLPPGRARVVRRGRRATVVTWGRMVREAITAAEDLDIEVIDLRTLQPWDSATVLESVRRTARLLVVSEAVADFGPGAEIAATVADEAFFDLDAPVRRLATPFVPTPYSPVLEGAMVVDAKSIRSSIEALIRI